MTILVLGATGRTGRRIVRRLREAGYAVRAAYRRQEETPYFESLGVQTALCDLSGDFSGTFAGTSAVIYAAGSAETEGAEQERQIDRDAAKQTADLAKAHGVGRVIVVSALSAFNPSPASQLYHDSLMKRESDDYVIASGVDYVILRPGPLSDGPAMGAIALATMCTPAAPPVSREDVAAVAVLALASEIHHRVIGFVGGNASTTDVPAAEPSERPVVCLKNLPVRARPSEMVDGFTARTRGQSLTSG